MFQLASSTTIFTAAQAANKKVSDQRLLAVRFTAAKAANKASVSLPRSPCGFTVAQAAKEVIASYFINRTHRDSGLFCSRTDILALVVGE